MVRELDLMEALVADLKKREYEDEYHERQERLGELRETLGWEGAVLIRVDGLHGSSVLSSMADEVNPWTEAVIATLGGILPSLIADIYSAGGATAVDFVDRGSGKPETDKKGSG